MPESQTQSFTVIGNCTLKAHCTPAVPEAVFMHGSVMMNKVVLNSNFFSFKPMQIKVPVTLNFNASNVKEATDLYMKKVRDPANWMSQHILIINGYKYTIDNVVFSISADKPKVKNQVVASSKVMAASKFSQQPTRMVNMNLSDYSTVVERPSAVPVYKFKIRYSVDLLCTRTNKVSSQLIITPPASDDGFQSADVKVSTILSELLATKELKFSDSSVLVLHTEDISLLQDSSKAKELEKKIGAAVKSDRLIRYRTVDEDVDCNVVINADNANPIQELFYIADVSQPINLNRDSTYEVIQPGITDDINSDTVSKRMLEQQNKREQEEVPWFPEDVKTEAKKPATGVSLSKKPTPEEIKLKQRLEDWVSPKSKAESK